ncbi:hypothetical protein TNCV_3691421 [Trichonephila clavipes]|nr:hypothetical protein TNCV_3691421 [Trichonephila clavipes]
MNGIGVLKRAETIQDNERIGRLSRNAENFALVSECVRKDRRQTLTQIAEAAHFLKTSCQGILMEDLNKHRVS